MNSVVGSRVVVGEVESAEPKGTLELESGGQRPCPAASADPFQGVLEFLCERAVEPFRSDGAICIRKDDFVDILLAAARENLRVVVLKSAQNLRACPPLADDDSTMWVFFKGRIAVPSDQVEGDIVRSARMLKGSPRGLRRDLSSDAPLEEAGGSALSPFFQPKE